MARAWILQANPTSWDVWSWWEDGDDELDDWTISRHLGDIQKGDDFALWISGREAGVYAIGKVASMPEGPIRPRGGYWLKPPNHDVWAVDLDTKRYLFDSPILKSELTRDPDFANALIVRMPGAGNPLALSPGEWQAIRSRVGPSGLRTRPSVDAPVVTARPVGQAPEDITVPTKAQDQRRSFMESRLVKGYERHIGRQLMSRSILLPSGERLVCDAFDQDTATLIEAKSSATRSDVRMAIGQLLDYRRHLAPKANLAVLLPEPPSTDLQDLLKGLGIRIIAVSGRRYVEA
jgi:hypothetical protein